MTNPDLDYAVSVKPYPLWFRLSLLFVALGLAASLVTMYLAMQVRLSERQAANSASNVLHKPAIMNPQLDESLALALETQQNLNFPWMQMLSSLETVKIQNPNIDLLSVSPNKVKSEVILVGEAKNFDDITQLIHDLKTSPTFGDAVLVSQRLVEAESPTKNDGEPIYAFNLQLSWRH
jgi:hypothetical protein